MSDYVALTPENAMFLLRFLEEQTCIMGVIPRPVKQVMRCNYMPKGFSMADASLEQCCTVFKNQFLVYENVIPSMKVSHAKLSKEEVMINDGTVLTKKYLSIVKKSSTCFPGGVSRVWKILSGDDEVFTYGGDSEKSAEYFQSLGFTSSMARNGKDEISSLEEMQVVVLGRHICFYEDSVEDYVIHTSFFPGSTFERAMELKRIAVELSEFQRELFVRQYETIPELLNKPNGSMKHPMLGIEIEKPQFSSALVFLRISFALFLEFSESDTDCPEEIKSMVCAATQKPVKGQPKPKNNNFGLMRDGDVTACRDALAAFRRRNTSGLNQLEVDFLCHIGAAELKQRPRSLVFSMRGKGFVWKGKWKVVHDAKPGVKRRKRIIRKTKVAM